MSGHVREHCSTPKINRHWKRAGMVWACSCGSLYRVTTIGAMDGFIWTWEEVVR